MPEKFTENALSKPELIPVTKWNTYFDYPTLGSIRQLIFYNTDNFNDKVLRKIGKRQYIKVSEFFKWVEDTNRKTA